MYMFLYFSFCLFGDVAFSDYFCTLAVFSWLFGECGVRFSLPDNVFLLFDRGLNFFTSANNVRNQSTVQSNQCSMLCVVIPFILDVRFVDLSAGFTQE